LKDKKNFDITQLKNIAEDFSNTHATSIYVKNGKEEIKLKKNNTVIFSEQSFQFENTEKSENSNITEEKNIYIEAERVGKFFSAHAPDSPDRIKNGSIVAGGEKVGNIVSMDVIYDVFAPFDVKIKEIMIEDGNMVEYGQALFCIHPLED